MFRNILSNKNDVIYFVSHVGGRCFVAEIVRNMFLMKAAEATKSTTCPDIPPEIGAKEDNEGL